MPLKRPIKERLMERITKSENGCWNWDKVTRYGYGQFWVNGTNKRVHRVAYESFIGEIPEGMCVCHTCDNPRCINPNHLWLGTTQENTADREDKGRGHAQTRHGENNPRTEFTNRIVKFIKTLSELGMKQHEIAKIYKVNQSTISRILSLKRWKYVTTY